MLLALMLKKVVRQDVATALANRVLPAACWAQHDHKSIVVIQHSAGNFSSVHTWCCDNARSISCIALTLHTTPTHGQLWRCATRNYNLDQQQAPPLAMQLWGRTCSWWPVQQHTTPRCQKPRKQLRVLHGQTYRLLKQPAHSRCSIRPHQCPVLHGEP